MSNFQDFLTFLGRPGNAVRSAFKGNFEGSARQVGMIGADLIDTVAPGDFIKDFTKPEDTVEFSDVIGGMEPGLFKGAVDIVGNMATDPLTYVPGAMFAKGVGLAGAGALKAADVADAGLKYFVPGAEAVARPALQGIRNAVADTMNWGAQGSADNAMLGRIRGAGSAQSFADSASQESLLAGLSPQAKQTAVETIQNLTKQGGAANRTDQILKGAYDDGVWRTDADWGLKARQVAAAHPNVVNNPALLPEVETAIDSLLKPGIAHREAMYSSNVFREPELLDLPGVGPMTQKKMLQYALDNNIVAPGSTIDDLYWIPGLQKIKRGNLSSNPYLAIAYDEELAKAGLEGRKGLTIGGSAKARGATEDRIIGMNVNDRDLITDADKLVTQGNVFTAQMLTRQKAIEEMAPKVSANISDDIKALNMRKTDLQLSGAPLPEISAIDNAINAKIDILTALKDPRYLDATIRKATTDTLQVLKQGSNADRDMAVRIETLLNGMPERTPLMSMFTKWSTELFKKPATTGLVIPNVSFGIRNRIGAVAQALAGVSARGDTVNPIALFSDPVVRASLNPATGLNDLRAVIDEFTESYSQAIKGAVPANAARAARDAVDGEILAMKAAMQATAGNSVEAIKSLKMTNPIAAEALENGIVNGFSSHDELLSQLSRDPATAGARLKAFLDSPAAANEALENRMRINFYMANRNAGKSVEQAANAVRSDLLDYSQATPQNRLMRDIIPFGAFFSQSIRQTFNSPIMRSAVVNTLGNPEEPIMPYMEDRLNVPLGMDEQGKAQYLTSLGLPFESVGQIPTGQQDALRKVGGMVHPLLRAGLGWATGEDPATGMRFGGNDKAPELLQQLGADERSEFARQFNLLGQTGLTTPLAPLLRPTQTIFDDKLSLPEKAMRLSLGARINSVDQNLAEQEGIKDILRLNPAVSSRVQYYTKGQDPEVVQMLEELKQASKAYRDSLKSQ